MSCLDRIYSGELVVIGIKDYNLCESPVSGLYLNDIEGMDLKTFAAIATPDAQSGYKIASDKIKLAIRKVVDDFKQYVYPIYTVHSTVESSDTGKFITPLQYNTPANLERGVYLERGSSTKFGKIRIKKIEILAAESGTKTVKIYDGNTVTNYDVDLVAGQVYTLYSDKVCDYDVVKVLMDNTGIQTAKLYRHNREFCGCCSVSLGNGSANMENVGWNGVSQEVELFGINVQATLECDENEIICQVLDKMYFLFWLRSGMEICSEIINSNRLNPVVLFSKDKAAALYDKLQADYDVKYKLFTESIGKYLSQYKDICLTCNRNHYVQTTP